MTYDEIKRMKRSYTVEKKSCAKSSGVMGGTLIIVPDYYAVVIEPYGVQVKGFSTEAEAQKYAKEKNKA